MLAKHQQSYMYLHTLFLNFYLFLFGKEREYDWFLLVYSPKCLQQPVLHQAEAKNQKLNEALLCKWQGLSFLSHPSPSASHNEEAGIRNHSAWNPVIPIWDVNTKQHLHCCLTNDSPILNLYIKTSGCDQEIDEKLQHQGNALPLLPGTGGTMPPSARTTWFYLPYSELYKFSQQCLLQPPKTGQWWIHRFLIMTNCKEQLKQ